MGAVADAHMGGEGTVEERAGIVLGLTMAAGMICLAVGTLRLGTLVSSYVNTTHCMVVVSHRSHQCQKVTRIVNWLQS